MSRNRLLRFISAALHTNLRRSALELDPYDAYALWAEAYPPEAHNSFMKLEQNAMLALLPDLRNKIVLDLACGSGRYLRKAQELGASMTLGVDFSPAMLSRALKVSNRLIQADMGLIPLESSSIDVIICGLAVGHLQNLSSAICEMSRVLQRGGYLVYSDFHPFGRLAGWRRTFHTPNGREYSVKHYHHLYSDHHAACRLAGLVIEEVYEPLIEGKHEWEGHPAVLAIRARKN